MLFDRVGPRAQLHNESGVRGGAPAQIDFYALFGLEMVTGGDNSH